MKPSFSRLFFAALTYLYPRSFRRRYGTEIRRALALMRRDAKGAATLRLWLGALRDALVSACREHARNAVDAFAQRIDPIGKDTAENGDAV